MITEYLEKNKTLLNFEANNYQHALEKMLAVSERKNHAEIIQMILKREALMPTAIGKSVALPRTILNDQMKTELIIAISPTGINLNSLDHLPVKIIFLYLFSANDNYPSFLAQSLRLLNDGNLRPELLKAKTEDELIKSIKTWEQG